MQRLSKASTSCLQVHHQSTALACTCRRRTISRSAPAGNYSPTEHDHLERRGDRAPPPDLNRVNAYGYPSRLPPRGRGATRQSGSFAGVPPPQNYAASKASGSHGSYGSSPSSAHYRQPPNYDRRRQVNPGDFGVAEDRRRDPLAFLSPGSQRQHDRPSFAPPLPSDSRAGERQTDARSAWTNSLNKLASVESSRPHFNRRLPGQLRAPGHLRRPGQSRSPLSKPAERSPVAGNEKALAAEEETDEGLVDGPVDQDEKVSRKRRTTAAPNKRSTEQMAARRKAEEELKALARSAHPDHMRKAKVVKATRRVDIPSTIIAGNLGGLLGVKQARVLGAMSKAGLSDVRSDRILSADDASLVALQLGLEPVVDDEAAFDIYPSPPHPDPSTVPLRPPIVCIMGHVDHGKTTLLDRLRSSSVAEGEAGGITQHIGAFQVPLSALYKAAGREFDGAAEGSISFLDTPGHAAFTAMRSRGANVTDIAVVVVAADDGVKPQTEEVIKLVTGDRNVDVVVAITKCDKPGVDLHLVKSQLHQAGLTVESLGGEVPCVEVSAKTGLGLDDLVETLSTVAEVRELRSEREGVLAEGRVIESHIERGRGNVATVLVTRGSLKPGHVIVAGTARCKIRLLTPPSGKALQVALPGQPVEIAGWKQAPSAGDLVLQAQNEEEARKAVEARAKRAESLALLSDVEVINEKSKLEAEAHNAVAKRRQKVLQAKKDGKFVSRDDIAALAAAKADADNVVEKKMRSDCARELLIVVKADYHGTLEAVTEALSAIGNKEARTKIVSEGVGDVTDGDIDTARSVKGMIIGFNVKASKSVQSAADRSGIEIHTNDVIYRIIDDVTKKVTDLLPPIEESHVLGQAEVAQIFEINIKGRQTKSVAGCRIINGKISKGARVRVLRTGNIVFDGRLDTLKQGKNDATSLEKGSECGISFDDFDQFQAGDLIQTYEMVPKKRSL